MFNRFRPVTDRSGAVSERTGKEEAVTAIRVVDPGTDADLVNVRLVELVRAQRLHDSAVDDAAVNILGRELVELGRFGAEVVDEPVASGVVLVLHGLLDTGEDVTLRGIGGIQRAGVGT